jgi:hypothetical protein
MMSSSQAIIPLNQIIISQRIVNAVKEKKADAIIVSIVENDGSFPLNRMDRMMEADFDTLLTSEPIEIRIKRSAEGKTQGKRIDGVMKPLYTIANGRHRVARAIIEGRDMIPVQILS